MKFGLNESEFKQLKEMIIDPLIILGCSVYIFGSRAIGTENKFSDIDLLIYKNELSLSKMRHVLGLLKEKHEESNFPYLVDMVIYDDLAENYQDSVKSQKIKIDI